MVGGSRWHIDDTSGKIKLRGWKKKSMLTLVLQLLERRWVGGGCWAIIGHNIGEVVVAEEV
jgi:hypothetical protein